jgi:opacity protein-like surface antigen
MLKMRSITAAVLAVTLMSSAALADSAVLPAGKPAGVQQANIFSGNALYYTLGFVALGVAIGVATSQGRDKAAVTSSTSTAP